MTASLLGGLVGALAGGVAGFFAAIGLQLIKGVRNVIMARRGAGQLRDMILVPFHLPGAVLGALLGAVLVHWFGLWGAAAAASVPPLVLLMFAIPATLWFAYTSTPLRDLDGPSPASPPAERDDANASG